jgi:hypothetical protein
MRTRPLLTINLIAPTDPRVEDKTANNVINSKKLQRPTLPASEVGTGPFVAISLTFPNLDEATDGQASETVVYRLNKVALIELGLIDEEDEETSLFDKGSDRSDHDDLEGALDISDIMDDPEDQRGNTISNRN